MRYFAYLREEPCSLQARSSETNDEREVRKEKFCVIFRGLLPCGMFRLLDQCHTCVVRASEDTFCVVHFLMGKLCYRVAFAGWVIQSRMSRVVAINGRAVFMSCSFANLFPPRISRMAASCMHFEFLRNPWLAA